MRSPISLYIEISWVDSNIPNSLNLVYFFLCGSCVSYLFITLHFSFSSSRVDLTISVTQSIRVSTILLWSLLHSTKLPMSMLMLTVRVIYILVDWWLVIVSTSVSASPARFGNKWLLHYLARSIILFSCCPPLYFLNCKYSLTSKLFSDNLMMIITKNSAFGHWAR